MTDTMTDARPADSVTEFDVPSSPDPEAPYGRTKDGKVRGKPGPKAKAGSNSNTRPAGPSAPPRRPATRAKAKTAGTDYQPGLNGLLQIASLPLAVAGRFRPVFALDAAALAVYGPGIAEALSTVAQEEPWLAAALDKVLQIGPYGLVIGATIPLIAQFGANHEKIPGAMAAGMGAMPKDEFGAMLSQQATGIVGGN